MNRLMTVTDVCERYSCSAPTARARMRQMVHVEIGCKLYVWLHDVIQWEQDRTVVPGTKKAPAKGRRAEDNVIQIPRRRVI